MLFTSAVDLVAGTNSRSIISMSSIISKFTCEFWRMQTLDDGCDLPLEIVLMML